MRKYRTPQGDVTCIRLDRLVINHDYQRELSKSQVKAIIKEFGWHYVGILVVVHVGNGIYEVCEGQHRLDALKQLFPEGVDEEGNVVAPGCIIIPTEAHKAFVKFNQSGSRRAPSPNEVFKANLCQPGSVECKIRDILNAWGININFNRGRAPIGFTNSPDAFKELFLACSSKSKFEQVIELLFNCFSRPDGDYVEEKALSANFIRALAKLVQTSGYSIPTIYNALWMADLSAAEITQRAETRMDAAIGWNRVRRIVLELEDQIESNLPRRNAA